MKIITDKEEIRNINERFVNALDKHKSDEIKIKTGFQGGSLEVIAKYSKELNIWWTSRVVEGKSGNRYWNGFGLGKPIENKGSHLVVELNYPEEGINQRIAGAWIQDGNDIVLIHSGKIGGGRSGIGKLAFQRLYDGSFIDIELENFSGKYTEIGSLNSPRLVYQIGHFVEDVLRIKNIITENEKTDFGDTKEVVQKMSLTFSDEFSGVKQYEGKGKIVSNCDHGLVVRNLRNVLKSRNLNVANDQQNDLYIYDRKQKITHLFEIKTSITSQIIYTAVGQLLINSSIIEPRPKLIFVVPDELNQQLISTLNKLGIIPLVYSWDKGTPIFKNINSVL